jgi:hypothetical protein
MGRGKFKGKPTGQRHFSTPEQMRKNVFFIFFFFFFIFFFFFKEIALGSGLLFNHL